MRESNPISAFNLATGLFGAAIQAQETNNQPLQHPVAIPVHEAVYPAITQEAFAATMDNYRRHVAAYNYQTEQENAQILRHNTQVENLRAKQSLTEPQSRAVIEFVKKHASVTSDRAYNEAADAFIAEHGPILSKRKIQTVKYGTELVFQNILHVYNNQLMKRNEQYMGLQVKTPRRLQPIDINAHAVAELRRADVQSLSLCKRSIRNHRQRLQECGVFVGYHFQGTSRPVQVHINPEILSFFDIHTGKLTNAENQRVSLQTRQKFPDNNDSTGTQIKKCQKKENVDNSLGNKVSAEPTAFSFVFYGNTTGNVQNPTEAGAGRIVKVSVSSAEIVPYAGLKASAPAETLSDKLQQLIVHPQQLAADLSAGVWNHYRPIDIRHLYEEATDGTLTREQFRELAIQDFFRSAAKLYREVTPFPGAWKKAINHYMDRKWITWNGHPFEKLTVVDGLVELRWRLEHARKFFAKAGFTPLFPADYFDVTRIDVKEMGFEYTRKSWERHKKYIDAAPVRKRKSEKNAELRKKQINYAKKCEAEIRKMFRHKITLDQLFDYVEKNLPSDFREKLPGMIEKIAQTLKR